jgi:hypothetical protein
MKNSHLSSHTNKSANGDLLTGVVDARRRREISTKTKL